MPTFKSHIMVCDVERDDGAHCGNKGGAEVKERVVQTLSKLGLRSSVYVSSAGCTSQHRLCDMQECSMIVYGPDFEATWYVVNTENVEEVIEKHLVQGEKSEEHINEGMRIDLNS